MPTIQYKKSIREKCKNLALEYLLKKRGSKGKEIIYKEIQTAEYLLPNEELNIDEQRTIFAIRNRMIDIPANFVSSEQNNTKCICKEIENLKHIYECKYLNKEIVKVEFNKIYNGTIKEQKKIAMRIEQNLKQRLILMNQPCDPCIGDPLPSVLMESSNGQ